MKYSALSAWRYNPLVHRACSKCGARMWFALIEPDEPGHHKLVFDCVECGHEQAVVVGLKDAPRPLGAELRSTGDVANAPAKN
jgi:Zn ribbon nucleic-acid-binding protein